MRNATAILLEAVVVVIAGLLLALAANGLSPRGLRLGRNYFPGDKPAAAATMASTAAPASGSNSIPSTTVPAAAGQPASTAVADAAQRRLEQRGLQAIALNQVTNLFRDPRYEQGLIVFIDARDDAHYQAGHIPGAWQFYHYQPETYMPVVLPLCMSSQQVIVYCNGGTCEDSEFAAVMLRDAGVPKTSLFVYTGGITEWKTNGMPVETGGRRSGQLIKAQP